MTHHRTRRDPAEIEYDILSTIKDNKNIPKTRLMNKVNLNYDVFMKYIELLKSQGYIEERDNSFMITEKGTSRIQDLMRLKRLIGEYKQILEKAMEKRRELRRAERELA